MITYGAAHHRTRANRTTHVNQTHAPGVNMRDMACLGSVTGSVLYRKPILHAATIMV